MTGRSLQPARWAWRCSFATRMRQTRVSALISLAPSGNHNPLVGGSNPPAATIHIKGLYDAARLLRGLKIGRGSTGASRTVGQPGTIGGPFLLRSAPSPFSPNPRSFSVFRDSQMEIVIGFCCASLIWSQRPGGETR